MKTYVVTGGAGFIGSHLADALLAAGHNVRVVDDFSTGKRGNLDPRCVVLEGDVRDVALQRRAMEGASGCFHLAAIASVERTNRDWVGTHGVNQGGTVAVLDAARAAGGLPVVYASSAAVYGDVGGAVAQEAMEPKPLTAYGVDKFGSELHARIGYHLHGVPSLGMRFFNVYGPRQDPHSPYSGVISIFARRAQAGETLVVNGDGQQTRDFIHVADVVAHLMAAMTLLHRAPQQAVLNVCTGRSVTVLELAEQMLRAIGAGSERIAHGPARSGDIRLSFGTADAAVALLGLRAKVGLTDGLQELMRIPALGQPASTG